MSHRHSYMLSYFVSRAIYDHVHPVIERWLAARKRRGQSPSLGAPPSLCDMRLPAVEPDKLIAYALASWGDDCEALYFRPQTWWWTWVRENLFPAYCQEHGPHRLPGAVLLRTARHLMFYYDQHARDVAAYERDNLGRDDTSKGE